MSGRIEHLIRTDPLANHLNAIPVIEESAGDWFDVTRPPAGELLKWRLDEYR